MPPSSDTRCQTYRHVPSSSGIHPLLGPVSWTEVQPDAPNTESEHSSSGPWLPSRLFCPARSLLTMTTSAPLYAAPPAYELFRWAAELPASHRGSPIYSASLLCHAVACTPVVPTTACDDPFIAGFAFAKIVVARQPRVSHYSGLRGSCNGAAAFT